MRRVTLCCRRFVKRPCVCSVQREDTKGKSDRAFVVEDVWKVGRGEYLTVARAWDWIVRRTNE